MQEQRHRGDEGKRVTAKRECNKRGEDVGTHWDSTLVLRADLSASDR